MRTTVPLVRPLDPNQTGPIELEFDVPAQQGDNAPPLFIGVRVRGSDSATVYDTADKLIRAGVSAEVHLYRLLESGQVSVALERVEWVEPAQVKFVPLAPDGLVPGLTAADADVASMQAAGLILPGAAYRELKFASAASVPAGRYRAAIRIDQNRQALSGTNAELLIAYTHKGK